MTDSSLIIVSACLAGVRCRYDGKSQPVDAVIELVRKRRALLVCPEQLGGLPTPRISCERVGRRILSRDMRDMTQQFVLGANEALRLARLCGCTKAVLKSRSPSCGCGMIYDGNFSGRLVPGNGVFAELLLENNIHVSTELDF